MTTEESIKFLLVDDRPDNLLVLETLLRREGLELLTATSGAEALELLLVHEVALAILDVQMPEMNGFELAELMRGTERTKHVPIIFVTAGARDQQRMFRGYESGAVDFLYKPLEPEVIRVKADVFLQLYRQRRELEDSLRLNEMFVGILGHDLRNPLNAMMTGARVLEIGIEDEKLLRTLRRMLSAGERMTDMIEQLLDLTRARLAGGLGFVRTRKPLDVGKIVQRTIDELRVTYPERTIVCEASSDGATSGDEDRLLQLFSNLIANAVQHGEAGSPVEVRVSSTASDIEARISNRGAIPAQLLPSIFDPFRGRQSAAGGSRGLGLGLFISQQIAVAHGGSIGVESSDAAGTTFTVRIPRRATAERWTPTELRTHPHRLMIVEDDENIRESLRDAFEDEGYVVSTAIDGSKALEALRQPPPRPEVIILDLVMPVLDGGRLYQLMQSDPELAKIRVIVSTANPERAPAGVFVLPKPLNLRRLLAKVAELCRDSG